MLAALLLTALLTTCTKASGSDELHKSVPFLQRLQNLFIPDPSKGEQTPQVVSDRECGSCSRFECLSILLCARTRPVKLGRENPPAVTSPLDDRICLDESKWSPTSKHLVLDDEKVRRSDEIDMSIKALPQKQLAIDVDSTILPRRRIRRKPLVIYANERERLAWKTSLEIFQEDRTGVAIRRQEGDRPIRKLVEEDPIIVSRSGTEYWHAAVHFFNDSVMEALQQDINESVKAGQDVELNEEGGVIFVPKRKNPRNKTQI